jgi:proteic killer suppression protein
MKIRKVKHKGLRRFMEANDPAGLPAQNLERIRNMVSFLQEISEADEARSIPSWRTHQLTGDRKGSWSLSVNRNWRITYRVDEEEGEILDLDYEDYH